VPALMVPFHVRVCEGSTLGAPELSSVIAQEVALRPQIERVFAEHFDGSSRRATCA